MQSLKSILSRTLATGCLMIIACEAISALSLLWLRIPMIAWPWTFYSILNQRFYFPVIFSITLLFSIGTIGYMYNFGDKRRIYAVLMGALLSLVMMALSTTTLIFSSVTYRVLSLNPFASYRLVLQLNIMNRVLFVVVTLGVFMALLSLLIFKSCFPDKNSSRFQSAWELLRRGHFETKGFIVGLYWKTKVYVNTIALLLVKPTQGGKTSAIAIPNLLEHTQSACVNDYKGELYRLTAKFREQKFSNHIYRWAPFADPADNTHGYNPFAYIRWEAEHAVDDLDIIVQTLINETPAAEASIWKDTSREVFKTMALFLYLESRDKEAVTLRCIIDRICNANLYESLCLLYQELDEHPLSYPIRLFISKLVHLQDERTRDNLMLSVQHHLAKLFSPKILNATDTNEINLVDMRKTKTTLYLEIPDAHKETMLPYITLLYRQFFAVMTRHGEPDKIKEPYQVLCILDEFGNLDKVDQLATGATTLGSYGFRFIFIVQNISQIYAKYGKLAAETFLSSGVKICGATNSDHDTNHFSRAVGTKLIKKKLPNGHVHEERQPLLTPDKVRKLSKSQWLVVPEGEDAMLIKQLRWYENKEHIKWIKYKQKN